MKLAVLIGVSHYDSQHNLSASKMDVALIKSLLDMDEKYESVLYIDNNTNTQDVKLKLSEFIQSNIGNQVDEFLFYFSGHGYFDGDDFHYIMSDFDQRKIKTTSLENSELDVMMKSISPRLTVKIVDACNAGVPYIKDPFAFNKYIDHSKQGFDKCYFMYSSEDSQSSFADANLSFFTKAIGEAVVNNKSESIRYKDIIDYVSDKFQGNENQSPIFISQASFTDVFITSNDVAKKELGVILESSVVQLSESKKDMTIKELIENDAKRFFMKEDAMRIYESIPALVQELFILDAGIKELYNIEITLCNDYNNIPQPKMLADWIHKNSDDLFVRALFTDEAYEKPVGMSAIMGAIGGEYRTVTAYRKVPYSVSATTEVPFNVVKVQAHPKYPNLNSVSIFIVPFISRTKLLFVSSIAHYKKSGWENESMVSTNCKWTTKNVELCNGEDLAFHLSELSRDFHEAVYSPIQEMLGLTTKDSNKTKKNN